jgi:hypothetical protein
MLTSAVLDKAADKMEVAEWITGSLGWPLFETDVENPKTLCLEGALMAALGIPLYSRVEGQDNSSWWVDCPAYHAVMNFIGMENGRLHYWNDWCAIDKAQVLGVLRGAAEVERAKEAAREPALAVA